MRAPAAIEQHPALSAKTAEQVGAGQVCAHDLVRRSGVTYTDVRDMALAQSRALLSAQHRQMRVIPDDVGFG